MSDEHPLARREVGRPWAREDEPVREVEAPLEGVPLVALRLVPVEVFGADGCGDPACKHCKEHAGFGIMDAVSAWSDCNRAGGRIYRVDDMEHRNPGDTVTVYVRPEDAAWFQRSFPE